MCRHHRQGAQIDYLINLGKSLWKTESGAAVIEYGLLVALVAVVVISAVGTLGKPATSPFEPIDADLAVQAMTAPNTP